MKGVILVKISLASIVRRIAERVSSPGSVVRLLKHVTNTINPQLLSSGGGVSGFEGIVTRMMSDLRVWAAGAINKKLDKELETGVIEESSEGIKEKSRPLTEEEGRKQWHKMPPVRVNGELFADDLVDVFIDSDSIQKIFDGVMAVLQKNLKDPSGKALSNEQAQRMAGPGYIFGAYERAQLERHGVINQVRAMVHQGLHSTFLNITHDWIDKWSSKKRHLETAETPSFMKDVYDQVEKVQEQLEKGYVEEGQADVKQFGIDEKKMLPVEQVDEGIEESPKARGLGKKVLKIVNKTFAYKGKEKLRFYKEVLFLRYFKEPPLSQEEVAVKLGVSRPTITRAEQEVLDLARKILVPAGQEVPVEKESPDYKELFKNPEHVEDFKDFLKERGVKMTPILEGLIAGKEPKALAEELGQSKESVYNEMRRKFNPNFEEWHKLMEKTARLSIASYVRSLFDRLFRSAAGEEADPDLKKHFKTIEKRLRDEKVKFEALKQQAATSGTAAPAIPHIITELSKILDKITAAMAGGTGVNSPAEVKRHIEQIQAEEKEAQKHLSELQKRLQTESKKDPGNQRPALMESLKGLISETQRILDKDPSARNIDQLKEEFKKTDVIEVQDKHFKMVDQGLKDDKMVFSVHFESDVKMDDLRKHWAPIDALKTKLFQEKNRHEELKQKWEDWSKMSPEEAARIKDPSRPSARPDAFRDPDWQAKQHKVVEDLQKQVEDAEKKSGPQGSFFYKSVNGEMDIVQGDKSVLYKFSTGLAKNGEKREGEFKSTLELDGSAHASPDDKRFTDMKKTLDDFVTGRLDHPHGFVRGDLDYQIEFINDKDNEVYRGVNTFVKNFPKGVRVESPQEKEHAGIYERVQLQKKIGPEYATKGQQQIVRRELQKSKKDVEDFLEEHPDDARAKRNLKTIADLLRQMTKKPIEDVQKRKDDLLKDLEAEGIQTRNAMVVNSFVTKSPEATEFVKLMDSLKIDLPKKLDRKLIDVLAREINGKYGQIVDLWMTDWNATQPKKVNKGSKAYKAQAEKFEKQLENTKASVDKLFPKFIDDVMAGTEPAQVEEIKKMVVDRLKGITPTKPGAPKQKHVNVLDDDKFISLKGFVEGLHGGFTSMAQKLKSVPLAPVNEPKKHELKPEIEKINDKAGELEAKVKELSKEPEIWFQARLNKTLGALGGVRGQMSKLISSLETHDESEIKGAIKGIEKSLQEVEDIRQMPPEQEKLLKDDPKKKESIETIDKLLTNYQTYVRAVIDKVEKDILGKPVSKPYLHTIHIEPKEAAVDDPKSPGYKECQQLSESLKSAVEGSEAILENAGKLITEVFKKDPDDPEEIQKSKEVSETREALIEANKSLSNLKRQFATAGNVPAINMARNLESFVHYFREMYTLYASFLQFKEEATKPKVAEEVQAAEESMENLGALRDTVVKDMQAIQRYSLEQYEPLRKATLKLINSLKDFRHKVERAYHSGEYLEPQHFIPRKKELETLGPGYGGADPIHPRKLAPWQEKPLVHLPYSPVGPYRSTPKEEERTAADTSEGMPHTRQTPWESLMPGDMRRKIELLIESLPEGVKEQEHKKYQSNIQAFAEALKKGKLHNPRAAKRIEELGTRMFLDKYINDLMDLKDSIAKTEEESKRKKPKEERDPEFHLLHPSKYTWMQKKVDEWFPSLSQSATKVEEEKPGVPTVETPMSTDMIYGKLFSDIKPDDELTDRELRARISEIFDAPMGGAERGEGAAKSEHRRKRQKQPKVPPPQTLFNMMKRDIINMLTSNDPVAHHITEMLSVEVENIKDSVPDKDAAITFLVSFLKQLYNSFIIAVSTFRPREMGEPHSTQPALRGGPDVPIDDEMEMQRVIGRIAEIKAPVKRAPGDPQDTRPQPTNNARAIINVMIRPDTVGVPPESLKNIRKLYPHLPNFVVASDEPVLPMMPMEHNVAQAFIGVKIADDPNSIFE